MRKNSLFTSESVTVGHPDRLADMISDAVLDRFLQQDPYSRVVAEAAIAKGVIFVAARFASKATVDIPAVAREVIAAIGYPASEFDASACTVVTSLNSQPLENRCPADEAELSDKELDGVLARNQVTQFGFACRQTPELMPFPVAMANRLAHALTEARRSGKVPELSPDGTTQIGVEFEGGQPVRVHGITLIAGCRSGADTDLADFRRRLINAVIGPAFVGGAIAPDAGTEIFVNPRGVFPKSGPAAHSGMTGRKTASETYGGYARHSGSAMSGKDPSRIDRISAYAARYAAKNVVAAGLAEECEVQLSYGIGGAGPAGVEVSTFGTGTVPDEQIRERLENLFDFRVGAIIRDFELRHLPRRHKNGFYCQLASHGQIGASFMELPWEKTDKAEALK
ncbi:methionine adenosyltransferase [Methylomagnum sp.]